MPQCLPVAEKENGDINKNAQIQVNDLRKLSNVYNPQPISSRFA
jgi:hypothetical protein